MDLQIQWHKPVKLRESPADSDLIYETDLERIPRKPGVYVFTRKFGSKRSPLYVDKAKNLRSRVKTHLNSVRMMRKIQKEAIGSRALVFGVFVPKPGQQAEKCISLIEKALIRHFLSAGHNLLNISGTHIGKHELISTKVSGRFVPHKILFE